MIKKALARRQLLQFLVASPLLASLNPVTYSTDDMIGRQGEIGRNIYFISQGRIQVISEGGNRHHLILEDGDYFGDLSLILKERRTASARALEYCEIFVLAGEDFEIIRKEYPEFKEVLKKMSSERTEKISSLILDGVVL